MSAHTAGSLRAERIPATFNPKMDGFQLVGVTPDGADLMTVALCTVNEADESNALRLAACWNAFEGYPIEAITSLIEIGGVRRLHDYACTLKENGDVLVDALTKAIGSEPCSEL